MSKYSQVINYSLRSTVINSLNEISTHKLNLVNDIINANVLDTDCVSKIDSLASQIENSRSLNGSITKLHIKLNNLSLAVDYIIKCEALEYDISNLEPFLYDEEGNINEEIEKKINDKKVSIANYERIIDTYLQ